MSTFIDKTTKARFTVSDDKDSRYEGARLGDLYEKVSGSGGVRSTSGLPAAPHTSFPPLVELLAREEQREVERQAAERAALEAEERARAASESVG